LTADEEAATLELQLGAYRFRREQLRLEGMPGATPPVIGVEHTTANTQFALAA